MSSEAAKLEVARSKMSDHFAKQNKELRSNSFISQSDMAQESYSFDIKDACSVSLRDMEV